MQIKSSTSLRKGQKVGTTGREVRLNALPYQVVIRPTGIRIRNLPTTVGFPVISDFAVCTVTRAAYLGNVISSLRVCSYVTVDCGISCVVLRATKTVVDIVTAPS